MKKEKECMKEINEETKYRKKSKKTIKKSNHKHEYIDAIFIVEGFRALKAGKICKICEKPLIESIFNIGNGSIFKNICESVEEIPDDLKDLKIVKLNKKFKVIIDE